MADRRRASVEEFKAFVKKHPSLVSEVRRGKSTWQELFEEWYMLGEDNERWRGYPEVSASKEDQPETEKKDDKSDMISNILGSLKTMDMNTVQQHISNLNQALGAISGVISQFQKSDVNHKEENKRDSHPFAIRKD
jgi:hypothetical protein